MASEIARDRFCAFIAEVQPHALKVAERLWPHSESWLAPKAAETLAKSMAELVYPDPGALGERESLPFVPIAQRMEGARDVLKAEVAGFFEREALRAEITDSERQSFLRGIIRTRAVDNTMKRLFLSGEIQYGGRGFQGKGFRSLGQEAIYACAWALKKGDAFASAKGESDRAQWQGDVVAPLIRDLGVFLAFTDDDAFMALNAQMGKAAPPLFGKDLHLGDLSRGVLPAAAPLSIAASTITGIAWGMKLKEEERVAVCFIGEGGSSLGEWHEAVNVAAANDLPAIFCVQNNQTALSTPVHHQTRVRVFADKALGYGMPRVTVDGTDPEAIAAAFGWAAARARRGEGPTLIETVAMRMCGHAHHDDMLYLGTDPDLGWEYPAPDGRGYANDKLYAQWSSKDPLKVYAQRLMAAGVIDEAFVEEAKAEAEARCKEAVEKIKAAPWPDASEAGRGVFQDGEGIRHAKPFAAPRLPMAQAPLPRVEDAPAFSPRGRTFLDGVARGLGDVLAKDSRAFILGEDVGPPYGNAFMLLRPLLEEYGPRMFNTPIAEGGIIAACVGAALEGMRPIGEIQFNDFVASGFNALVNNAAKLHYRTGLGAPFVLRMPWGGLRRAGPFHSQDTIPWFYRTFGLKIVVPSTPHDARALMMSAHDDPNPVLFYEHIALYRDPSIKQPLDAVPEAIPLGKAAFRRTGGDLSIITYGAFVHRALAAAEKLAAEDGVECDVLDLRSIAPLDWPAVAATVAHTGKVLLVGEDSRTGSVLESIAARIGEEAFEHLDGPVLTLGALDTPVPYAPSLEDAFLITPERLLEAARTLLAW
jgi:2-oxoisovalerate dehydrogenase E1 component